MNGLSIRLSLAMGLACLSACGVVGTQSQSTQVIESAIVVTNTIDTPVKLASTPMASVPTATRSLPPRTAIPTTPALATPNPTEYLVWTTYQNDALGITFEYPLYFGMAPYVQQEYHCAPNADHTSANEAYVFVGQAVSLSASPLSSPSLSDFVDAQIKHLKANDEHLIDQVITGQVDKTASIRVDYRNARNGQQVSETYFTRDGIIYNLRFELGVTCDFVAEQLGATSLTEIETYERILQTFQFKK